MKEDIIYIGDTDANLPFRVTLAGTSYCDGTYKIIRKNSVDLVVEYVISGEGTIFLDEKKYCAREGDVYILPLGRDQLYFSDAKNPWVKIWFNAKGVLADNLPSLYNPKNMVIFPNSDGKVYIDRIHAICQDVSLSAQKKHEKSALVFHEMLQYLYAKYYIKEKRLSDATATIKDYIDNHITLDISLKMLGDLVYLSQSQVIRTFRQDLGMTPYEYILEAKLERAKLLLKNSSLMVKEIAAQLGFCDEHYFSSLFRQKTGDTPTAYRKSS